MSNSDEIEPTLEVSDSAEDNPEFANPKLDLPGHHGKGLDFRTMPSNNFKGYAGFLNSMVHHGVPIYTEKYTLEESTVSVLGQGGTFIVRTAKLRAPLIAKKSKPFLLKTSQAALTLGQPVESATVDAGTYVVTKHINFSSLRESRADGTAHASKFLTPFELEATILSHPDIRRNIVFPSLLGIGLEIPPDENNEMPQHYPYLIMELGQQGSLEQGFRELWYRMLQNQPGLPVQGNPDLIKHNVILPWKWKVSVSRKICRALCVLHDLGVVHGDIKLPNTLAMIQERYVERPGDSNPTEVLLAMPAEGFAQLADFGSSILLKEIPVGGSARLQDYTFPWNAPEFEAYLNRCDLIKTDIYSYGLLFARIMLQGGSPFDLNAASALGYSQPTHDSDNMRSFIKSLQDADRVHEHISERIWATGFYSIEQMRIISIVLHRTLRTQPKARIGTLKPIHELLSACGINEPQALNSVVLNDRIPRETLRFRDGSQADVHMSSLWDDSFIGRYNSASEGVNIPNLLDPVFADVTNRRILMREVFEDLKHQTEEDDQSKCHMAQAHYQTALCYFNGWGTLQDSKRFFFHLYEALHLNSNDALWLLRPISGVSSNTDVEFGQLHFNVEENPVLFEAMLAHFPWQVDMTKAIQLQKISPQRFKEALRNARAYFMERPSGERQHIAGMLSVFMDKALGTSGTYGIYHDTFPEEQHGHTDYMDAPFMALCLAASEGNMNAIHELLNHVRERTNATTRAYLNRSTNGVVMGVKTLKINAEAQSAEEVERQFPISSLNFELNTRPLMMACANGHSEVALLLLAQGADPNLLDASGRCPLHYLARFDPDKIEEVGKLLLKDQPETLIDKVDGEGNSPLAFVLNVRRNWIPGSRLAAARFLLSKGAGWYNMAEEKAALRSPLAIAVLSWDLEAMKLVKSYAQRSIAKETEDLNAQEPDRIHMSSYGAYHYKSNKTSNINMAIFHDQILFAIAELAGQPDITHYQRGAAHGSTLTSIIQFLVSSIQPDFPAASFAPVVYEIVRLGALRVAIALAATLPSFNWYAQDSRLLDEAVQFSARNFPCMLTTLARLGYDIDQVHVRRDQFGNQIIRNFLHMAANYRIPVDVIKGICQITPVDYHGGLNDSSSSPSRLNAFDMAIINGHFRLADYLRANKGADFRTPHLPGLFYSSLDMAREITAVPPLTILGYVVASVIPDVQHTPRRREMLKYLLPLGPDSLVCPAKKLNVFHVVWMPWAHISKDYFHPEHDIGEPFREVMDIFDELHAHFPDANLLKARDVDGATPLHFAVRSGNISGVKKLIQIGVDLNARDKYGISPIWAAAMALYTALNFDPVSGEAYPVQVSFEDVLTPVFGKMDGLGRVGRSVMLSRVLESIRKQRQAADGSDGVVFRTRREEPTQIVSLLEIYEFLKRCGASLELEGSI